MRTPQSDLERELEDPEFAKLYGAESAKMDFGILLSLERHWAGMSQVELARLQGCKSQSYLSRIERGKVSITLGTAGKLLAALGLRLVMTTKPLKGE